MYERVIKRLLDIVLSLAGIAVLAVPMLIISLAIKLGSGRSASAYIKASSIS